MGLSCECFTEFVNFRLRELVANMFENCLDKELWILMDLFIPEHQHVWVVSPPPARFQHLEISSLEEIAFLIKISKGWEGGVEIKTLEESVVMVVRHTGILAKLVIQKSELCRMLSYLDISPNKNDLATIQQIRRQ